MPRYPKVQSPCPYKGELSAIMDGDTCRLCRRPVLNLDAMEEMARAEALAGCAGPVCVSYGLPAALAAAALAAGALAAPGLAAAQSAGGSGLPADATMEIVIIAGGITDPATLEHYDAPDDPAEPELPVVYDDEDGEAAPPAPAKA